VRSHWPDLRPRKRSRCTPPSRCGSCGQPNWLKTYVQDDAFQRESKPGGVESVPAFCAKNDERHQVSIPATLLMLGARPSANEQSSDRAELASTCTVNPDALLRSHPWNCAVKRLSQLPIPAQRSTAARPCRSRRLPASFSGRRLGLITRWRMASCCARRSLALKYIYRNTVESTWDAMLIEAMELTMAARWLTSPPLRWGTGWLKLVFEALPGCRWSGRSAADAGRLPAVSSRPARSGTDMGVVSRQTLRLRSARSWWVCRVQAQARLTVRQGEGLDQGYPAHSVRSQQHRRLHPGFRDLYVGVQEQRCDRSPYEVVATQRPSCSSSFHAGRGHHVYVPTPWHHKLVCVSDASWTWLLPLRATPLLGRAPIGCDSLRSRWSDARSRWALAC
jgi:hypothetical protein